MMDRGKSNNSQIVMAYMTNDTCGGVVANSLTWESLSFKDKMKFFNVWFFIASIGNICNIGISVCPFRSILYLISSVLIIGGIVV
jgi:hypothetical protein